MFKKIKSLLLASSCTLGLSLLLSHTANAATYTTVQGDSLYKIGTLFNTTSSTIMKQNSLSSDVIYPGQALYVPSATYTVKSGDSLYLIAKKYSINITNLRKANNLWTDIIYPGQVVNLPEISLSTGSASNSTSVNSSTSVISYSASDIDLLARLITAEADGQPYNAKVAVGAVVVNRVKSGRFANTLSGVIYQKIDGYYQFTPVKNGWIYNSATTDAVNAAYEALRGNDPTNGALYYFDNSTTNSWLWSKPISIIIGKLVFAY